MFKILDPLPVLRGAACAFEMGQKQEPGPRDSKRQMDHVACAVRLLNRFLFVFFKKEIFCWLFFSGSIAFAGLGPPARTRYPIDKCPLRKSLSRTWGPPGHACAVLCLPLLHLPATLMLIHRGNLSVSACDVDTPGTFPPLTLPGSTAGCLHA